MKKKLSAILAILSALLSGCTREIPDASGVSLESLSQSQSQNNQGETSSQAETSSIPESPPIWAMEEEYKKIDPSFSDSISSLYGLGVMPGHVLLSVAQSDMQEYRTAMDYDLENDEWREIGKYSEINIMSADQLQIGMKNYFAYEDIKNQYQMVCIDISRQEVSYPNTFDFFPPLAFYEASEEGQFCLYLPDTGSSEDRSYHIYLYHTSENSYEEIVTKKYSETTGTGTIVQDISVMDQQLYLCCGVYEEEGYDYKIIVCGLNGEQQREIILEDLKSRLQQNDETIQDFYVLGECFFFKTLSSSVYLYAYENGALRLIDLPSDHLTLDTQRGDNIRDIEQNPYYYFWDSEAKILYPFNCRTKTFSRLQFNPAGDETLSIGVWDDADGNILMSYYKSGQRIPDYYYIPQSTILKYMG